MHTENLDKSDLVRAAIVAQLAKPVVEDSSWDVGLASARYTVITWFGIIGSTITIFSNLEGVLKLASWARWIATYWTIWITEFWSWPFRWLGITISTGEAACLTFIV